MRNKHIELRVGEWYSIGGGTNQCNRATFDDVHKLSMVDEVFFRTHENGDEEYTIEKYEFVHESKKLCEKREALIKQIQVVLEAWIIVDKKLVKQIEALDDKLDIPYHDGKYAESCGK